MLKSCPKCKKLSDTETRICICGFWFIENKLTQTSPDLRQLKREKLKRTLIKCLVLSCFVIFVCVVADILGGFTNIFHFSGSDKENSSLADLNNNTQNISPSRRFPKGKIEGKVVAVNSGGMITLLDNNNQEYKVKLGGIDTPEPDQDFGQQSKENLAALILDKNILVNLQKIDEGGLLVGKVIFDNKNINLEQIKAGFAWNNRNPADGLSDEDRQLYAEAENTAKTARAGFWLNTKTDVAEVPNETVVNPTSNETVSEQKSAINPEVSPNSSPTEKNVILESRTESEIPSGFTEITPVASASPSSNANQPNQKATTTIAENKESKPANKTVSAIARCTDGTLSFSASRSGACSNHGGVASWLDGSNLPPKTKPSEKTYIRGLRGGCYYLNQNGKKTYVDQSLCK